MGDEDDSHLGDFIEDKNIKLPLDAAIQNNLREATTGFVDFNSREESFKNEIWNWNEH